MPGRIHEVQLWSVARTQVEIQQAMHQRPTGAESGLAGYWPMNAGSGQAVADGTAHGLDGVLGPGPDADPADPAWTATTWPHS